MPEQRFAYLLSTFCAIAHLFNSRSAIVVLELTECARVVSCWDGEFSLQGCHLTLSLELFVSLEPSCADGTGCSLFFHALRNMMAPHACQGVRVANGIGVHSILVRDEFSSFGCQRICFPLF